MSAATAAPNNGEECMNSRWIRWLAALLALLMIAAACGSDDEDDETPDDTSEETSSEDETNDEATTGATAPDQVDTEPEQSDEVAQSGGEIAIGLEAEIVGMRPWDDTCGSPCMNVLTAVYDRLTEPTAEGEYEPFLLESIEPNDDFTAWVGVLREGVTFHNGVELTAQSVADMYPIWQEGSQSLGALTAAGVTNIEATGDLEVTWTLGAPHSAFPAFLSRAPIGMVFEPAAAAAAGDAGINEAVGTGPFSLESRDLDNETVIVRNPDYWMTDQDGTQLPYLDKIIFRPIPDEGTRLDALLSGTTNVAHTLRQGTIRDARDARDGGADIQLYEFQGNNVGGGMFNFLVPPYDDVRVRRALVMMMSQEGVIEALGGTGISLPGTQWFSQDSPWYSETAATAYPTFDFEGGVALLQEYIDDPERSDGKAVGEQIDAELSCPPDPTLIAAMQVIEQTWSASELVNIELTNYDQQTHVDYALGADNGFIGNHTTHCWRVATDEDPSTFLNQALAPPTAEVAEANGLDPAAISPLNWSNYFDLEVFNDLVAAKETDVFEERYALYEKVMTKIGEDVPVWYTGHTATALVTDANIMGLNSWELPDGTLGAGHPNAEGRWGQAWISE